MLPNKQLFRHEPDKMQFGDCHRTALACLLNIPPEDSPHFIGEYERREALKAQGLEMETYIWQDEQAEWLSSLGYCTADVAFDGTVGVDQLFSFMRARNPEIYYMLGGTSPRGTNHSVVCYGGQWEWDPHPDGGFLVGPLDNGVWEITFLLPLIVRGPL